MMWARYTLGEIAPAIQSRTYPIEDNVWHLDLDHIESHTGRVIEKRKQPKSFAGNATLRFDQSHILYSKLRPYLNKVVVPDEPGIATTELVPLQPRPHLVRREFLAYYLRSPMFLAYASRYVTSAKMPRVILARLWDHEIQLPSLSEQDHIISILNQAAGIRRLRVVADAQYGRLIRATFAEMFGRPKTGWEVSRLGCLLRQKDGALQSGPFGSHLHNHDFVASGAVLAVGIDNVLDGQFVLGRNRRITRAKYEELKKYTLEPGDVLIIIMGTVGRTCVFPGEPSPAICTKHVYRIQPDGTMDPDYLCAALRFSQHVRAQLGAGVTGQIVSGINSENLRRLEICVPPLFLQSEFARRKREIDGILDRAGKAGEICDALFDGLMHLAFTGDLTASRREGRIEELLQEVEHHKTAENMSVEGDRD